MTNDTKRRILGKALIYAHSLKDGCQVVTSVCGAPAMLINDINPFN